MILCLIKGAKGKTEIKGYEDWFSLNSFSFNVERELKDTSKAGSADVNLGVADMQECSMSKNMDAASISLAKFGISGASCGTAEVKFLQTFGEKNVCYLQFKMDNAFVKSWSVSGDADDRPTEEITLWYNKIAFIYFTSIDGKEFKATPDCAWDASRGGIWKNHGLDTAAAGA